jgi:gas vesicle protein
MGKFTNGLLLGVGIGLLVTPMRGEEMRRVVSQRVANIRTSLSQNGQGSQYIQQASDMLSHTANTLKENAQQAATDVRQTSQDVAEATKQTAQSTKSKTSGTNTPS